MSRPARLLFLALGFAVLTQPALAAPAEPTGSAPGVHRMNASARFVGGEVIVRFERGTAASERAATLGRHGAAVEQMLPLPGLALARVAPKASVRGAARALAREPSVVYAEPNFVYQLAGIPNDPRFGELWGLHNAVDTDVDAPEAWDRTTGSSNVTVAVVDSGIAYNHPELAANVWVNPGETENGVDDDGNGLVDDVRGWDFAHDDNVPLDNIGHGSHVAGTIGARGNNAIGVAGLNWNVKLMALRAGDMLGLSGDAIVRSFAYACANGARVVNGSFGGPGYSQAVVDAISACPQSLFVFAAGNGGEDGRGDDNDNSPAYPCAYPSANIVCVAASGRTDALTSFSNFGATSVDLAAPGESILSTVPVFGGPIFADTFETSVGGRWSIQAESGNAWAQTGEAHWSGGLALSDSPFGPYAPGTSSWVWKTAPVNLAHGCIVDYMFRIDTELDDDWLLVDGSADGAAWVTVGGWSGSTAGAFFGYSDDLSLFDGGPAYVRFRLQSDADGTVGDGAYVDDVAIRCLATGPVGAYDAYDGTSMAAPHVAGVAALVLAANPGFSTAQIRNAILASVDRRPALAGKVATAGRVNAFGAVAGVVTPPPPPPPPPPEPPPPSPTPPSPPPPPPPPVTDTPPDTFPPNTRITAGPPRRTTARRATFRFVSTEAGSTFSCRLDRRAWRSCASPRTYRFLKRGFHTFRVHARDRWGNVDPTAAVRTWRIR